MATLIKITGEESQMKSHSLTDLQGAVGGYIAHIYLKDGRTLVVNEEGLLYKLAVNPKASALYGNVIVGNVVLLEKGETK